MASDAAGAGPSVAEREVRSHVTLRLAFPCVGEDLVAARSCEQVVFGRRFGNTPGELRHEYGPYETWSCFGAVLLPDGRAVGAVRVLRGAPAELKSVRDWAQPPWSLPATTAQSIARDLGVLWDVATFAVDRVAFGAGHQAVTRALLSVLFGAFQDNRVKSFVAIVDSQARGAFAAHGVLMTDLPGASPAPYLGSAASVPVYVDLEALHAGHARDYPDLHGQVFHGRGVPGAADEAAGRFALSPFRPRSVRVAADGD